MGTQYSQITIEERCEMARLRTAGHSIRQVAASLDRSPSTVSRELKRNGSRTRGYLPAYADQQAHARRWKGSRLERDAVLRDRVLSRLQQGWSPEQVVGRLALESGKKVISHETIYRFIYGSGRTTPGVTTCRGPSRVAWAQGRQSGVLYPSAPTAGRTSKGGLCRHTPGHWEADLCCSGSTGRRSERHSRILIAVRPPGKAASPIANAMAAILAPLPTVWRQTIAFDNGTEFARHHGMPSVSRPSSAIPTALAEGGRRKRHRPHAALPAQEDFWSTCPKNGLLKCCRRILAQMPRLSDSGRDIWNKVLRFKCESTLRPSPERRRFGRLAGLFQRKAERSGGGDRALVGDGREVLRCAQE